MEKKEGNTLDKIKSVVKQAVSDNLINAVKSHLKNITHKVQDIAYQTEKKILDNLFAEIVMLAGLILITLSIVFFIIDYFVLERYWGFLIVGLVLVIISLIYKRKIEKTKYYSFER